MTHIPKTNGQLNTVKEATVNDKVVTRDLKELASMSYEEFTKELSSMVKSGSGIREFVFAPKRDK